MVDLPDDRLDDLWPLDDARAPATIKLDAHAAAFPAARRDPRQRRPHAAASALYSNTGKRKMASQPIETNNPRPMIEVSEWKPMVKNTLRGFVTVTFPMGLIIKDVTVHVKGDRRWVGMPAKPQLDREGKLRYVDGKLQYQAILAWASRDRENQFGQTVCRLISEKWPGSLAG